MEAVYTAINNRINPGYKNDYKKLSGFDIEDELVRFYIKLGARSRSVSVQDLLARPIEELTGIAEEYIAIDVDTLRNGLSLKNNLLLQKR